MGEESPFVNLRSRLRAKAGTAPARRRFVPQERIRVTWLAGAIQFRANAVIVSKRRDGFGQPLLSEMRASRIAIGGLRIRSRARVKQPD